MIISVNSVEQTTNLGMELGKILNAGDIICLTGDLGTGKTHITKGIAKGLGITDYITSPTFTIVNEYDSGRLKLNHFDVYRVSDPDEIYAIVSDSATPSIKPPTMAPGTLPIPPSTAAINALIPNINPIYGVINE